MIFRKFKYHSTGFLTKNETVKTTENSINMTIWSLIFGFCIQFCILMVYEMIKHMYYPIFCQQQDTIGLFADFLLCFTLCRYQGCNARKVISEVYTHLLYCRVLSLGANVNTRRMSKPDMGSIFHIKKSMKYSGHWKLLCELSKL